MNESKPAIVVNSDMYKVEFVVAQEGEDGEFTPLFYEMQEGEQLIFDDACDASMMLRPRWVDDEWVETATSEELEEWQASLMEGLPEVDENRVSFSDVVDFKTGLMEGFNGH